MIAGNNLLDLTGQKYNRLSPMWPCGYRGEGRRRRIVWLCLCDCGQLTVQSSCDIKRGRAKSCGCLRLNKDSALQSLFCQYKQKAKERKLIWALSLEQFRTLILSPCFYTGLPPQQTHITRGKAVKRTILYNGIDRVDNSKGYEVDNVVPCWGPVNKAKLMMSQSDFIKMCNAVTSHCKEII